jgi:hypothetical protein
MESRRNYQETVYVLAHPNYGSASARRNEQHGSLASNLAASVAVLLVAAAAIAGVTYQVIFMLELLSQVLISGGI